MLPWVSAHREQQKDEGNVKDMYLDCKACNKRTTPSTRAMMLCGWVDESEHIGSLAPTPPGAPNPTVCPGYTIQLPEVYEAARALGWKKDGCIREFYPDGLTAIAIDALDTVDSAINSVQRHAIRKSRREASKK